MVNVCHLADCMDHMRDLPDNHYDLAIVDPPYGIGSKLTSGGGKNGWHLAVNSGADKWDIKPTADFFRMIRRVSTDWIIWGANYFGLDPCRGIICWDKKKSHDKNNSHFELAYSSFDKRALLFSCSGAGGFVCQRIHPTQKPVALYKWLLSTYAKPGDKIFDSHVGSGSIRIACHDLDFDFEGCEIDRDYWEAQEARFTKHTDQLRLL